MIRPLAHTWTNAKVRRWILILSVLAAAAVGTLVAVHPWKGAAASRDSRLSHFAERASQEAVGKVDQRQNAGVQIPGPPDPLTQETAAASAARAADAAAALAASAQPP